MVLRRTFPFRFIPRALQSVHLTVQLVIALDVQRVVIVRTVGIRKIFFQALCLRLVDNINDHVDLRLLCRHRIIAVVDHVPVGVADDASPLSVFQDKPSDFRYDASVCVFLIGKFVVAYYSVALCIVAAKVNPRL